MVGWLVDGNGYDNDNFWGFWENLLNSLLNFEGTSPLTREGWITT